MFRLESEIMEYLRRMYYFAKRIAKLTVEDELNGVSEKIDVVAEPDEVAV